MPTSAKKISAIYDQIFFSVRASKNFQNCRLYFFVVILNIFLVKDTLIKNRIIKKCSNKKLGRLGLTS